MGGGRYRLFEEGNHRWKLRDSTRQLANKMMSRGGQSVGSTESSSVPVVVSPLSAGSLGE